MSGPAEKGDTEEGEKEPDIRYLGERIGRTW